MFHLFIDTTYYQPDITAPGMDILAAWSPIAPPTPYASDTRSLMYNVISGTSMATPHASAAAAYVKAAHPDWSPAAIKSALMTTSFDVDPRKHPDLEFSYGAGHINPTRAIKQGLIFAADEEDYVKFLGDGQEINAVFTRTVTNVGKPSTYHAALRLLQSSIYNATVKPSTLTFSSVGGKNPSPLESLDRRLRSSQSRQVLWFGQMVFIR